MPLICQYEKEFIDQLAETQKAIVKAMFIHGLVVWYMDGMLYAREPYAEESCIAVGLNHMNFTRHIYDSYDAVTNAEIDESIAKLFSDALDLWLLKDKDFKAWFRKAHGHASH